MKAARAGPEISGADPRIFEPAGEPLNNLSTEPNPRKQAPELRDYQRDAVGRIRAAYRAGSRRVLFQLPTGGGKTVCFAHIIAGAVTRGTRTLVLAHRVEILEQIDSAIGLTGVPRGLIMPGELAIDAPVQVASVATIARRLDAWRDRFDLVVIDECHHAVAGSWAKVIASQPQARVLGVSGTPERLDGRGLGEIFDELVVGPSTTELIEAGWLSRFTVFEPAAAPDLSGARIRAGDYAVEDLRDAMDGVVIGAAVREYRRLCPGVPAVTFCVDVGHSQAVAEAFRAAGVRAVHVDGETPASERRAAIASLGNGSLDVICNCGLISEGVDVPSIGAAILLRPTASLSLYLQQVGRALRPAPGKERALILDFSGNTARHGLPDATRVWTLDAKPRRRREHCDEPRLRKCPTCSALNRAGAQECVECGADLKTPKERREIEMALQEAKRREIEDQVAVMSRHERWSWAGTDEGRLRVVARVSGYSPGWVWHRMQEGRQRAMGGAS